MKHCDRSFLRLLRGRDLEQLDSHKGAIFGLWSEGRLAALNQAWFRFAEENGGQPQLARDWGLGANVFEAIRGPLRRFYRKAFRNCLREGRPWSHRYECSSPELLRVFHMKVFPLGASEGLLVVNSLVVEHAHDFGERPVCEPELAHYQDEDGAIRQCSYCRRVRRTSDERQWDWIPRWVDRSPPESSHVICGACLDYYYPNLGCDEPEFAPQCASTSA
ncbi:MAG: hypothetical protein ACOY3P_05670 [Planctomycetota bacterium]